MKANYEYEMRIGNKGERERTLRNQTLGGNKQNGKVKSMARRRPSVGSVLKKGAREGI
ncbi:unnamed protein product, partial [Ilex paraguariensis]